MFINISSDRIFFVDGNVREELPFGDIEKNFPHTLYTFFSHNNSTCNGAKNVVLLHGPGSFTHIRIGTLALNTYNMLHNFVLDFVSINKLQWYGALYKAGRVPRYGVLYIGQKKNFWLVDFEKFFSYIGEQKMVGPESWQDQTSISGVLKASVEKIPLITYIENPSFNGQKVLFEDMFFDELLAESKELIQDTCEKKGYIPVFYRYNDSDLSIIKKILEQYKRLQKEKLIDANYMIEANVF